VYTFEEQALYRYVKGGISKYTSEAVALVGADLRLYAAVMVGSYGTFCRKQSGFTTRLYDRLLAIVWTCPLDVSVTLIFTV
jgi:hypothetical protein